MTNRRQKDEISQNRLIGLVLFAHFFLVLLIFRLFQIQVVDRTRYIEMAKKQYFYETELKSQRGIIYDRELNPLAVNEAASSIAVDGKKAKKALDSIAVVFSRLFGGDKSYYLNKIDTTRSFTWIRRFISNRLATKIDSLKLPGVRIIKEEKRFYPHGPLAANIVGFTNVDMQGLSGIEKIEEDVLRGDDGLALYQRDNRGRKILDLEHPVIRPRRGKNVVLTINSNFQWIAQEELKKAVEKYEAEAGVVIISNPNTGEILTMAVFPEYDPNQFKRYPADKRRNRAITDIYEPGSTFKSMVMAAILEEKLGKPSDLVYCENGVYKVYREVVTDVVPHGWLTLAKVIKKSSNIGMAKLAQQIDKRVIYKYLRDFGFGMETGIDLPGEVSGELRHFTKWKPYTQVGISIGYGIAVTPLQLVMAYGAIANGGYLLKPQIIRGIVDDNFQKLPRVEPEIIRRVISDSTAKELIGMLEGAVRDGTGKRAYIKGLRIAGKTGTAMKYDPKLKKYSQNKFVSSFIGFFPADSPQILIYVMLDNPRKGHLGGKVAAPTFKKILSRIVRFIDLKHGSEDSLKINPQKRGFDFHVPRLVGRRIDFVRYIAAKKGWKIIEKNSGDIVRTQKFVRAKKKNAPDTLFVTLKQLKISKGKYTFVPNVMGKSLRDAVSKLSENHLKVYVRGSGIVKNQIPKPGTKIRRQARCIIECEPPIQLSVIKSYQ